MMFAKLPRETQQHRQHSGARHPHRQCNLNLPSDFGTGNILNAGRRAPGTNLALPHVVASCDTYPEHTQNLVTTYVRGRAFRAERSAFSSASATRSEQHSIATSSCTAPVFFEPSKYEMSNSPSCRRDTTTLSNSTGCIPNTQFQAESNTTACRFIPASSDRPFQLVNDGGATSASRVASRTFLPRPTLGVSSLLTNCGRASKASNKFRHLHRDLDTRPLFPHAEQLPGETHVRAVHVALWSKASCRYRNRIQVSVPRKSTDICVARRQICRGGRSSQKLPIGFGISLSRPSPASPSATFERRNACSLVRLKSRGASCAPPSTKCSSPIEQLNGVTAAARTDHLNGQVLRLFVSGLCRSKTGTFQRSFEKSGVTGGESAATSFHTNAGDCPQANRASGWVDPVSSRAGLCIAGQPWLGELPATACRQAVNSKPRCGETAAIPAGGYPAHSRGRRETRNSDLVIGGGSNQSSGGFDPHVKVASAIGTVRGAGWSEAGCGTRQGVDDASTRARLCGSGTGILNRTTGPSLGVVASSGITKGHGDVTPSRPGWGQRPAVRCGGDQNGCANAPRHDLTRPSQFSSRGSRENRPTPPRTITGLSCPLNGLLHFGTDFVTSRISSKLWAAQRWHDFFVVIGVDQLIHQVTLAITMAIFFAKL